VPAIERRGKWGDWHAAGPLRDRLGREAVRGVGGTNCDWWFTDDAVFLDTAGRYTTHESNRDRGA
jgi:type VI protein secretion system component VasK